LNAEWVDLLKDAHGRSEYVIVVAIDIRGFTSFCERQRDRHVATYIKKVYMKILNDYFPESTFSKPMGDGLFLTIRYGEENLVDLVNTVVDSSIKLVDDFETLLVGDPMITYIVPDRIGIGLTRGSACCIVADNDKIIDYSGVFLNHAARLVDKARPHGIVCDYKGFNDIIKPELKELFKEDEICLRGISEKEPIKILYLKDKVIIDDTDRLPIYEPIWHEEKFEYNCKTVKTWRKTFIIELNKKPISPDHIFFEYERPKFVNGKRIKNVLTTYIYDSDSKEIQYFERGGLPSLRYYTESMKASLEIDNPPDDVITIFRIRYMI